MSDAARSYQSARRPFMLAEWSKRPERQRGSWSFLTWSFFLAQMVAAEQFYGSGAKAAESDDASTARIDGQSENPADDGAVDARWGFAVDDGVSAAIPQHTQLDGAQGLLFPGLSQLVGSGDFGALPSSNSGGDGSGGGGLGGSSATGSDQAASLGEASTPTPTDALLPPADGVPVIPAPDTEIVVIPGTGFGSDLNLDLDVGLNRDLVVEVSLGVDVGHGGIAISLGSDVQLDLDLVPNTGLGLSTTLSFGANSATADASVDLGLVNDAGLILQGTTLAPVLDSFGQLIALAIGEDGNGLSSLEDGLGSGWNEILNGSIQAQEESTPNVFAISDGPVASIVSNTGSLATLQQGGDVSSGDAITFSGTAPTKMGTDDLFTGGRYTDYSLALQSDVSLGSGKTADQLGTDIVDKDMTWLTDSSGSNDASDQAHLAPLEGVDASHVGLPSTVEELSRADSV